MKQRVITAIAIIAVVFFPVYLGGIPLELLALVIVAGGCFEWMNAHRQNRKWPVWFIPLCAIVVLVSRFIPSTFLYAYYAFVVALLWALPIFFPEITSQDSFTALAFFMIFSLIYKAIGLLQIEHRYLWTIVFATYASDTFAYLVGRKLGKHKMIPRVSPKKSWEGFIGGVIGGFALSLLVSLLYIKHLDVLLTVSLCIMCPIVAELGDLAFSVIKRSTGKKDFSNLLPGHGGILDRTDSLLMNILLFGILVTLIG
ncbi:phosphatidate cytidylyltransferase [Floccifex sp.]|uniref:phosphatidate cytidylyltransferase n=1 Tax=Floccifex sp. TaxID=2815810 RepID=UPI002A75550E|nr:phosphatidate cytidylyltransferase [Floccifex sp.]MDD7281985.1 phosphatidate cytidylyltransferase [Erysipelotrichaceae bacterium]MDY2958484.1 phosphatidate cytidylyltransferase [Floccifex sp.]